jgi:hypothetical protein
MLNAREPKIVNGPQILDKYVGESEANIRKLFAEADEEEKRVGSCRVCVVRRSTIVLHTNDNELFRYACEFVHVSRYRSRVRMSIF